jgi:hypothetical protein
MVLHIQVPAPTKRGTVGESGGSLWEMEGKSQRLENVTIYHHGAVEGFQFSYVDEHGQIRTTATWGQISPVPQNKMEVSRDFILYHACACGCFANHVGSCLPSSEKRRCSSMFG